MTEDPDDVLPFHKLHPEFNIRVLTQEETDEMDAKYKKQSEEIARRLGLDLSPGAPTNKFKGYWDPMDYYKDHPEEYAKDRPEDGQP